MPSRIYASLGKRGPDRGLLVIEEVPSPVFHYERSLPNEAGELLGRPISGLADARAAAREVQVRAGGDGHGVLQVVRWPGRQVWPAVVNGAGPRRGCQSPG